MEGCIIRLSNEAEAFLIGKDKEGLFLRRYSNVAMLKDAIQFMILA